MSSTTADRTRRSAAPSGPRRASPLLALALASGLAIAPGVAQAQGDKAGAESLFQAGKALMAEGNYDKACPKFAESNRLDPSVGTLLNLGKCYEAQGKTASAWAEFKEAARLARNAGQTEREAAAKEFAAKLEPTLSKLRIDAAAPDLPGLVIRKDGADVGKGMLGSPVAVDPGEHTIEASAPGHKPWSSKVTIGPNGDAKTVTIPALEKGADEVAPAGGPITSGTTPPPAGADTGGGDTRRTAGFVLGGVGVVGVGLGAIFGLMASSQAGAAEDDPTLCPDKKCTAAGRAEIDGAGTKALISTIGFGVGIAGLAAGVILIVTSGPSKPEATTGRFLRVAPSVGANGGGLTMVGRF